MALRESAGRCGSPFDRGDGVLVDAHDLLFVLLTVVAFVVLALCAKGAEKL